MITPNQERWLSDLIERLEREAEQEPAPTAADFLELARHVLALQADLKEQAHWRRELSSAFLSALGMLEGGRFGVPKWREALRVLEKFLKGGP